MSAFHMQEFVHRAALIGLLSALALLAPSTGRAEDLASAWSTTPHSRARLIAAGGAIAGHYRAALVIELDPGWLTYWRQPGDAGVPPVFSFANATNLSAATPAFPAPTRFVEAGSEVLGYHDRVTLPLDIVAKDPGQPVGLDLALDYAICERICVPAKAHLSLSLMARPPGPFDAEIAAATADLPVPLQPATAARTFAVEPEPAELPTWHLHWTAPSPPSDIFVEAPEGWYVETHKTDAPDVFRVVAVEKPKDATIADPVIITTRGPGSGFQAVTRLDATRPSR